MTNESAILRAYALLSQGKGEEAERMLKSAPGALQTPSGADLFARIRFEQGLTDEARQIWQSIHETFPDFEPATKALDAFVNPPPDEKYEDDESFSLSKRLRIAAIVAVAAGVMASVVVAIKGCHSQSNGSCQPVEVVTNTVERVETKIADRCVTNFVDKVRTEFVDRIVTNFVEKTVEVPSLVTLTNTVEHIVCITNQITVVVTNAVDLPRVVLAETGLVDHVDAFTDVEVHPAKKIVLSTPYVVRRDDTVGRLAKKYGFRILDFNVYNPEIGDINRIRVGQVIQLPGEIKIEEGP